MPPKKPDLSGYQYSALSSLVISADRSHRRPDEPTGESESLAGRINVRDMGAAVKSEGVKDLDKKRKKAQADDELNQRQPKRQAASTSAAALSNQNSYTDILQATAELEGLRYNPRTAETRDIYELILSIVHTALGDQAQDIIRSAADTTLEILKDDDLKDLEKKKEIEEILGNLNTEAFGQLVNLSKKITDYDEPEQKDGNTDVDAKMGEIDQETGVAVLFDDEEEESDQDGVGYVVRDGSDDSDASDDEGPSRQNNASAADGSDVEDDGDGNDALMIGSSSAAANADSSQRDPNHVSPRDIDAFWIQRQISHHYPDAHEASEKADSAFDILSAESDVRDCENSLMELFDYDKFELVQILTKNRDAVVWCTRLARADEEEKVNVQVAMREKGVAWILKALQGDANNANGAGGKAANGLTPIDLEDAQRKAKRLTSRATIAPGSTAQPRRGVDLEAMAFTQGGHLNTNPKVRLPEGSFKRTKKGYEEIHIPAPIKRTVGEGELVPIASLPEWAQAAFPGAMSLNPVQSRCYPVAFGSDEPMLLCAPTGAGKTNVAMLTILNEVGKWRDEATGEIDLNAFKIVYVAPMKALVSEQAANFRDRLQSYGITVNELTGDSQLTKAQIAETQIIVTTPEKWDVISRKSTDTSYTNLVRLMIVDEIHLLHDDRGPVLEAIISRTIRRMEQMSDPVRLVGLSATLPNYQDVATFLRVNPKSGLFYFEANYRPCPLKQEYVGITEKKAIKRCWS